jgi:hemerythrin-like domain-containing protein
MKATRLLEKQHKKTLTTLKKLEKGADAELASELARELSAHMAIEHELFYPAVRAAKEDMIEESFQEHSLAELALKRMLACSEDDPTYRARVVALRELIEHHVEEEEEELFTAAEKVMDEKQHEELGKRMQQRFEEHLAEESEPAPQGRALATTADKARMQLEKAPREKERKGERSVPRTTKGKASKGAVNGVTASSR